MGLTPNIRLAWVDFIEIAWPIYLERRQQQTENHKPGLVGLAEYLGVNIRQLHRWKDEGFTPKGADTCAVALGLHPVHIWGDAWLQPGPYWTDDKIVPAG